MCKVKNVLCNKKEHFGCLFYCPNGGIRQKNATLQKQCGILITQTKFIDLFLLVLIHPIKGFEAVIIPTLITRLEALYLCPARIR